MGRVLGGLIQLLPEAKCLVAIVIGNILVAAALTEFSEPTVELHLAVVHHMFEQGHGLGVGS